MATAVERALAGGEEANAKVTAKATATTPAQATRPRHRVGTSLLEDIGLLLLSFGGGCANRTRATTKRRAPELREAHDRGPNSNSPTAPARFDLPAPALSGAGDVGRPEARTATSQ